MEEELDIHKVIGALECYANDPLCDNDCSKCPYGYSILGFADNFYYDCNSEKVMKDAAKLLRKFSEKREFEDPVIIPKSSVVVQDTTLPKSTYLPWAK